MTVNENMRRIRIELGLTQKQVAERCHTVDAVIRTYELGKANPKPATVAKIAKALGVSPAELYGVNESEQDPSIALALYQSESGGVIDDSVINKRRLLKAFDALDPRGQELVIEWAEKLSETPMFRLSHTVAETLAELTEEEQQKIRSAQHSIKEAELELSLMEKNHRKSSDAVRNSEERIKEGKDVISKIILAVLDRKQIQ